jgi:hypothetical protein
MPLRNACLVTFNEGTVMIGFMESVVYVSAWELAVDLKKHVSDVKRDLTVRGIKPAFDPHKVRAVLYRREDL